MFQKGPACRGLFLCDNRDMSQAKRIYLDTEFHQRVMRGVPSLELISIAMVEEGGRSLHLASKEFNLAAAKRNTWLRENVLPKLPPQQNWKTRKDMRDAVLNFIGADDVQMVYWVIPHDIVLFEQLVASSVVAMPKNIERTSYNLAQHWADMGKPNILPIVDTAQEHSALYDAYWLRDVDIILRQHAKLKPA